jgi:hypothetical protein
MVQGGAPQRSRCLGSSGHGVHGNAPPGVEEKKAVDAAIFGRPASPLSHLNSLQAQEGGSFAAALHGACGAPFNCRLSPP